MPWLLVVVMVLLGPWWGSWLVVVVVLLGIGLPLLLWLLSLLPSTVFAADPRGGWS